jgi:hypothetical protein
VITRKDVLLLIFLSKRYFLAIYFEKAIETKSLLF